ncbi:MAG TPA: LppX_LprAFG lipoprotein [Rugosimonospora sp.]|nr:LppX_LprAFG lipoprotein [Rugosimonospora sp.]
MPRTRRPGAVLALVVAVVAGASACSSSKAAAAQLPAAAGLFTAAEQAMRDVKTVHATIDVVGTISGLLLHRADVQLTREGKAKGTGVIEESGQPVEVQFVIVGSTLYLKGPTGGYQQLPLALASTVYDPSAVLDPDRGVVRLLATAGGARTEAAEAVDGQQAYRVAFSPADAVMKVLVPGVGTGATAEVWVAAGSKRLLKAVFTLPATSLGKGGTATIRFTDYDQPVTINAP